MWYWTWFVFFLYRVGLLWCTCIYKLKVYQQWNRKWITFTVFRDWHGYRHTTCTCRELQSYDFLGYEVMLVSLRNLAIVISLGSLAATRWQQSRALCGAAPCPVRAFCRTLLQDSSAPFWPSLEIQTREDFLHISAGYQDWSQKFCGQHNPWC